MQCPYFSNEETRAQKGDMICSRSPSWLVAKPGKEPRSPDSSPTSPVSRYAGKFQSRIATLKKKLIYRLP